MRHTRPTRRRAVTAVVTLLALLAGVLAGVPAAAAAPRSQLAVGQVLAAGAALVSADGRYTLTLQTGGNLVLTSPGRTMWATNTAGSDARLQLQSDGNLVLYDGASRALWNTRTSDGRSLVVQDDGNLVLYGGTATNPRVSWAAGTPGPRLGSGEVLDSGETMTSSDGRYRIALIAGTGLVLNGPGRTLWTVPTTAAAPRLAMQTDGNLVLLDGATAVWSSKTNGRPGAIATLAAGRLDITQGTVALWHSPSPPASLPKATWLYPGERIVSASTTYALTLQTDGNLVLYGPGGAAWSTKTAGAMRGLLLQSDGNLVLYRATGAAAWTSVTAGTAPGALSMQDDGHLVLYTATTTPVWAQWARSAGLTAAVNAAAAFGAASGERTAVAVLDRVTGQLYGAGDVNGYYASASLVKVFIAARLLTQNAQADPATANLMYSMITRSDDSAATQLWPRAGGAGVTDWVKARYGLTGLLPPTQAGWWGLTQVTANAMVRFYAAVKKDPVVGPWLTNAMAHAANVAADGWNQWFGIPSATTGWKVKQGWMCCLDNRSRLHSTGFLAGDRYTAAILTDGSTAYYGQRGADVVTGAAVRLLPGRKVPA